MLVTLMPMDVAVIAQEKTIQNIEDFDKTKLKHTETLEKNPLPDKTGKSFSTQNTVTN
jgi:Thymosin beta-4 family